jgi:hypothetical protein
MRDNNNSNDVNLDGTPRATTYCSLEEANIFATVPLLSNDVIRHLKLICFHFRSTNTGEHVSDP